MRKIPGLDAITISNEGVSLGAKVRWRDIENHPRLEVEHPLLAAAVKHIAHYQIRNRGTVGGSLAHADLAAELPGVAVTCDAEIVAVGSGGSRSIAAVDFFLGPMMTALAVDEVIVELRLPPWPVTRRCGRGIRQDNEALSRLQELRSSMTKKAAWRRILTSA